MTNPLLTVMPKVISILQEAGLDDNVLLYFYKNKKLHWNMKLYFGEDFALVNLSEFPRTTYQFTKGEPGTYLLKYKLKSSQLEIWIKEIYTLTKKELDDSKTEESRYYININLKSGEFNTEVDIPKTRELITRLNDIYV